MRQCLTHPRRGAGVFQSLSHWYQATEHDNHGPFDGVIGLLERDLLQKHDCHRGLEERMAALKTKKPAVIISDIGMPDTDGYQLIREVRAWEIRTERIPALALTAFARAEDRKRSLVAGYQAHLAEPFDVGEPILVVADLVGR